MEELDLNGEFYDSETLIQQVKIYKIEYFKVLEWNKKLKKTILELEQELDIIANEHSQCQEYLGIIDHLNIKLKQA